MSTEQPKITDMAQDDIGILRQNLNAFVLPIEKKQQLALCSYLEREMLNFSELVAELLRVPAAALQVCRVAGDLARRRDIDILTLEQACNLLGTHRLNDIIKDLPVLEASEMPDAYRQILSISEHALAQSQGLFAHRMARLWHEVSLASLLFLSPCWVLVYLRPEIFEEWDAHHLDKAQQGAELSLWLLNSERVLGLAQKIARDWWLPPWIMQGYRSLSTSRKTIVKALHIARDSQHPQEQQAALDADRNLSRWLTLPANSLVMANGLALGAYHDWDARHTRRWQQLTALYLGQSVAEVQAASHVNAVNSARNLHHHHGSTLWLPAEALIWPGGSRRHLGMAAVATTTATAPGADSALWRQACTMLASQHSPFANLNDLIETALHATTRGLGAEQSWVALYNSRKHELIVLAEHGFAKTKSPVGLSLGEGRGNAWGQWLQSDACHEVNSALIAMDTEPFPHSLFHIATEGTTRLLPLFYKKQLIGLLGTQGETALSLTVDKQRLALIKTAECLNRALVSFKQKT
jgi:hypothetical protein